MKRLIVLPLLAALAACGAAEEDDGALAATAGDEISPDATALATTAADGGPSTGTFRVINAEGEISIEVLADDGTYTSTDADGEVETGTWEQRSPNEFCAKPEDEEEMTCYAEEVNADGLWTSTDPDDGEVSTIERVAEMTEG